MSWKIVENKSRYKQGYYTPENPEKYLGDKANIFFRSSWELKLMLYLDRNPSVKSWSSEPFPINYINLATKKQHRYFVDFWAIIGDKKILIEVKPSEETHPPKKLMEGKANVKSIRNYNRACLTYIRNISKWKAASEFCKRNNLEFKIFTEKDFKSINIST